jgi:shikimate kinase
VSRDVANHPHRSIALIGFRGAGKSTVGRALAERLQQPFIDTDHWIEQSTGMTIRELFSRHGEARFRELETDAIRLALDGPSAVISVGGGALLNPENRRRLGERAVCIWLRATPRTLRNRIQADPLTASQRPPLTERGVSDEIESVLGLRTSLYADTAHAIVDTDEKSIDAVTQEVAAAARAIEQGGRRS